MNGIETERKFIIKMPAPELLARLGGDAIVQIYLESEDGVSERVRARSRAGGVTYTHTKKRRISSISAYEDEREISEDEFLELAERQEHGTSSVKKTRYVMMYRGFLFEIDVYPGWRRIAVMEVELPEEGCQVSLPPEIEIIKEVSENRKLSNHSLSRHMPDEEELLS